MNDKKQSLIVFAQSFDGSDRENWPQIADWLSRHLRRLEDALHEPLARLGRQVRAQDEESE